MNKVTIWFKFAVWDTNYYLIRDLSNYFKNNWEFLEEVFYTENYSIYESDKIFNEIVSIDWWKVLWYYDSSDFDIHWKFYLLDNSELSEHSLNTILFIEWSRFILFDDNWKQIKTINFSRKIGKYWFLEDEILDWVILKWVIYPSKAIKNDFFSYLLKIISYTFPGFINSDSWNRFFYDKNSRSNNIKKLNTILDLMKYIDYYYNIDRKEVKIKKKDFDPLMYEVSRSLESYILEMWWFDKIEDDSDLTFFIKEKNFNTDENQYLLNKLIHILQYKEYLKTFDIELIINKLRKLWVKHSDVNKLPKKLLNHPVFSEFLELIKNLDSDEKSLNIFNTINNDFTNISEPIKSINLLYEIYCFINFYEFLQSVWFKFDWSLKSNLQNNEWDILKYEDSIDFWCIKWTYLDNDVNLFFWDKITNKWKYKKKWITLFSDNFNFSFLSNKLKWISKDWITPDISFVINWNYFIWDVKFSWFKNQKLNLDFPNPSYISDELLKYRRIIINWNISNNPIFLFYPSFINSDNFDNFKNLHEIVLSSYNIFLFPIYQWNFDCKELKVFITDQFINIINRIY